MIFIFEKRVSILIVILLIAYLTTVGVNQVIAQVFERFPLAGHPVEIVAIHPDDKNAPFFKELSAFKLILMEPGIIKNLEYSSKEDGEWYHAKIFLVKGKTKKFSHRQIIYIKIGRFK
jgi:hypothetical protein